MKHGGYRCFGVLCIVLAGCGGGDGSAEPALRFVVAYRAQPSLVFPSGTVMVGPVAPDRSIGTAAIASVELTLYGQPTQVLRQPNFERKEDGIPRYVFPVAAGFSPSAFDCNPGQHPSSVLVTDVNGYAVGKSLDFCPGSDAEVRIE